jgi:hypothetical protein
MSEFLDRLIARSAGLGEIIRPRTPSLFEPYFLDSARVVHPASGNTKFEEPGLAPDGGPHPLRGETVQLNDREPVPIQVETAPNPSGQVTPAMRPGRLRNPAVTPSVSSQAFFESRDVASAGIHRQPLERANAENTTRLIHATNVQPRSVQVAFKESWSHSQLDVAPSATPPSPAREIIRAASVAHDSAPESAVNRRTVAVPSHSIDVLLDRDVFSPQPVLVPARALAESTRSTEHPRAVYPLEQRWPSELQWPAEPQPTIQVTIGRIEVRAEQPFSLPPTKERSNLKPMSLDEYLRRRTSRRRE